MSSFKPPYGPEMITFTVVGIVVGGGGGGGEVEAFAGEVSSCFSSSPRSFSDDDDEEEKSDASSAEETSWGWKSPCLASRFTSRVQSPLTFAYNVNPLTGTGTTCASPSLLPPRTAPEVCRECGAFVIVNACASQILVPDNRRTCTCCVGSQP